eukprot:scaffold1605_cov365-Pavlova_lutheri.AAC.8
MSVAAIMSLLSPSLQRPSCCIDEGYESFLESGSTWNARKGVHPSKFATSLPHSSNSAGKLVDGGLSRLPMHAQGDLMKWTSSVKLWLTR